MTVEQTRPKSASKTNTTTSIGRFYEKRQQFDGALDQYNKILLSNPDNTATYIDRSRVFLKIGSIDKAQKDTDAALNRIDDRQQNSNLLSYNVYLQKAEVLYANGEFELALMYFYRANKIKPTQQICLEGIEKTREILQCTICNHSIQLTITNINEQQTNKIHSNVFLLLHRSPIRKQTTTIEQPLTKYTNKEANRLLLEIAKDRQLLINLHKDSQFSANFTGLNKAKIEAQQTISILETQLHFLDKAECFHINNKNTYSDCMKIIAEKELIYLQNLPIEKNSIEILYRSMKILNCLQSSNSYYLAETYRLIGRSYFDLKLFIQSSENYKYAYEIIRSLNNKTCLYRSLFDYGRSLILISNYKDALEIFNEILIQTIINDNERAFICQYISFCYLNLKNYSQAKIYAYQSIDYACQTNNELLLIESNILLGKIYLNLKDYQRAQEYLIYARNSKDLIGDLNQIKYLDELLNHLKTKTNENFNQQWILSNKYNSWRLLTPYYYLFEKEIINYE